MSGLIEFLEPDIVFIGFPSLTVKDEAWDVGTWRVTAFTGVPGENQIFND